MELQLNLTVEDGQKILDCLIKEPYKDVYKLVNKIQEQAKEQVAESEQTVR